jgi:hypothetical protein
MAVHHVAAAIEGHERQSLGFGCGPFLDDMEDGVVACWEFNLV